MFDHATLRLPNRVNVYQDRQDMSNTLSLNPEKEDITIVEDSGLLEKPVLLHQGYYNQLLFKCLSEHRSFPRIKWNELAYIILSSSKPECFADNILVIDQCLSESTDSNFNCIFNSILNEETVEFIKELKLQNSITWLLSATPNFFPGASFEIEKFQSDDDEESNLLALRIYSSFDIVEFRERRHQICQAMLEANHVALYEMISIFQRKIPENGWEALSFICKIIKG